MNNSIQKLSQAEQRVATLQSGKGNGGTIVTKQVQSGKGWWGTIVQSGKEWYMVGSYMLT